MQRPQTIAFEGILYRTDHEGIVRENIRTTAANSYAGAPHKFFALDLADLDSYKRNLGTTLEFAWQTTEPLNLIDMRDLAVRNTLFTNEQNRRSLGIAFPIRNRNGSVGRYSDAATVNDDNRVISSICNLYSAHGVDGYIIRGSRTNIGFHEEVAVCSAALRKLRFMEVTKFGRAVQRRTASFNSNISFNYENNKSESDEGPNKGPAQPEPPKEPAKPEPEHQVFRGMLFANNNIALPPPLKRQKLYRRKSRKIHKSRKASRTGGKKSRFTARRRRA